jgi:tetratricopeptide (TPR) repeat protein
MKRFSYFLVLGIVIFLSFKVFAADLESYHALKESFNDGFYSLALSGANAFLTKYPESDFKEDVSLIKGLALFYLQDYHPAVLVFENLRGSKNINIQQEAAFYLGKLYALSKEHDKAVKLFSEISESEEPGRLSSLAGYELGLIYFENKDYDKAASYWSGVLKGSAIAEDIKSKLIHNLVQSYIKIKDTDKAGVLIKESISSNTAEYYLFQGKIDYLNKDYKASLDNFNYIIESEFSLFWTQKAKLSQVWVHIDTENYKEAEEIITSLEDSVLEDLLEELSYLKPFLFYKRSVFAPAIRNYQRFIFKYHDSDWQQRAVLELIDCYYNVNKFTQAERLALQFLTKEAPSDFKDQLRHMLGWVYYKKGDLERAVEEFGLVAESSRNIDLKINSLCRVGDLLAEMGKIEEAMEKYNIILKNHPDSLYAEYAQYQLGIYLLKKGDYKGAILAFHVAIKNFPRSLFLDKVHFYLAEAYFKEGDYKAALSAIEVFLASKPEKDFKEKASVQKAALLYNLGNYDEAEKFIKESEDLQAAPYARFIMAKIFLRTKRLTEADNEYDWLKNNLDDPDMMAYFYFHRAELDFYLKEWDRALSNFKNAYHIAGKDRLKARALYWQGWSYYNKNELEKAFNIFDSLKDSQNLSQEARYNIALIFVGQDRIEQALTVLNSIADQDGRFKRIAILKLADIYKDRNNRQEALKEYRRLEKPPYDIIAAEASFKIGEIYELDNMIEEAILQYLSLATLYNIELSFVNKARVRCARLLEREARYSEAEKLYKEVANTSSEEAIYARARLKKLEELK